MPNPDVSIEQLSRLAPLSRLSEAAHQNLLAASRVDTLDAGKRLPARNRERWVSFVLEGSMQLIRGDDVIETIDPEVDAARLQQPLFADGDDVDYATTLKSTRLLSIARKAVEEAVAAEGDGGAYDVGEQSISTVESDLLERFYKALSDGRMQLPSMPEIAIRIRELAADAETSLNDLAKVIQVDPSLTARLLQAANSAAYRGTRAVGSVREAITRLGLKRTASLAISITMHNVFKARSPQTARQMQMLWETSVEVSATAYIVARHSRVLDPDHALLAGLMHRVGAVPILLFSESLETSGDELKLAIARLSPMVGGVLLKEWGFEHDVVIAVEEGEQWMRNPDLPTDLCDIIIAARLYADLRNDRPLPASSLTEIPAFRKLGLADPESDRSLQVLEDAAEEIASIREFLS
ncbi:HDOD domain-containing protein [Acidihalobacter prosperus]|uniref:HDOD domain-containing protein n=1 Tax=Acidihalobacter prosperus TaxID=160660 RepID=A0A1A6C5E3_9GAMM|nr:HDOD domain-containing protein [Acidihalobacter prosperus]OBS09791.1 HDOD domain-containing protein [Acidihalobacter prosperus]